MSIVNQQITTDKSQGDYRRVRYLYTDSAGGAHIVGPLRLPLAFDATADLLARIPGLETELANAEFGMMQQQFYAGDDPLRDTQGNSINPVHQSRNAVIARLLREALSSPDPLEVMQGESYMANVTDAEMMALLSVTQTEVNVIRQKSSEVASIKALVDAYAPPLSAI